MPLAAPDALHDILGRIPFSPSLAIAFCLGLFCSALIAFFMQHRAHRRQFVLMLRLERLQEERRFQEDEIERLRLESKALLRECRDIDAENAALQSSCATMRQQLEERAFFLDETRQQIEQHFQATAAHVFNQQNQALARQHESALNLLLRPLYEQIGEFRHRLDEVHGQDSRDRLSILKEMEQLRSLNQQLSSDAVNLTEALRGKNKVQGQWGELLLSRVLEASGLRPGHEFDTQVHRSNAEGTSFQPDAVVYLPENREVIIDSKVSLKAFADAQGAASEEERRQYLRQHVESVKRQISVLAAKQYHLLSGPGALDYVLLFIPVEGAFQVAVDADPELLMQAMRQKIILSSPSTLLAILRTIHHLWRVDEQHRNSLAIAKQAASLYDKLVGFAEAFEEIGLRLNQTQQAWHTARNRLSSGQGNLIAKTEAFKALGVQPVKDLPESLKDRTLL